MKFLKNADIIFSCVLLVTLTVVAFMQVLFRYVFNTSLSWSEEIVRYSVITLIYVSTIYSIRTRSAIRVEIIDIVVKGKAKSAMDAVVDLFSSGIMLFVSYLTVTLVQNAISVNQRSAAMGLPMAIMYGVECVTFLGMGLAFLTLFITDIKNLFGGAAT